MIRQNFSMPSPISIKQRTNMILLNVIVSHLFTNRVIMAGWHGHNCHYSLHIMMPVITSLLLPVSGVVCDWDGGWSHSLAPAPGPAMHWLPTADNTSIFVTFVTWALLSPCPSLISELESITIFVSVWEILFMWTLLCSWAIYLNHPTSCIC